MRENDIAVGTTLASNGKTHANIRVGFLMAQMVWKDRNAFDAWAGGRLLQKIRYLIDHFSFVCNSICIVL